MWLQEEEAATLGLSTGQALAKLRDQLSGLLEHHQRPERRQAAAQVAKCTSSPNRPQPHFIVTTSLCEIIKTHRWSTSP